jgi:predicted RNA methylase
MILWRDEAKVWRDRDTVARRPSGFDLTAALAEPGFTPRTSDLPALVQLLAGDEAHAAAAERGILRIGPAAAAALLELLRAAAPPLRGRLARVLGLLGAADPALVPEIVALTRDAEPKTRRNAAIALGKLPGAASEDALLALLAVPDLPLLRSAVDALGKIGGPRALPALAAVADRGDAELARLLARARVRLERTLGRGAESAIDVAAVPGAPLPVVYLCRAGLEGLLRDELGGGAASPGRVAATLRGSLAEAYRARLFVALGFPLARTIHGPTEPDGRGASSRRSDEGVGRRPITEERRTDAQQIGRQATEAHELSGLGGDVVRALTSDAALAILRRFTRGAIRYRLEWAGAGPRRAETLRVAAAVAAARPELTNDPTGSPWEVSVSAREILLLPRAPDPRFAYRVRDVPAASHPTIAAALARLAGAREGDVVWDPFVGSATELIERALLGPARTLRGTDIDASALAAARANLTAARVAAELAQRDAATGAPPGTTLILTNPPMGRRVRTDVARLLDRILAIAARDLPPGGRLAWISPLPARTARLAAAQGLIVDYRQLVDMGGFEAEMQLISRPGPSTSASPRSRG